MPPLRLETFAAAVDHTLLDPGAGPSDIDRLCDEALRHGFAAVCVYPWWAKRAARRLGGGAPAVCTVAGFPHGLDPTAAKIASARRALADGAGEIDVVVAWAALRAGDEEAVEGDVRAVVEAIDEAAPGAVCKVIVEASQLGEAALRVACAIVERSGARFAKTSTGVHGQATREVVAFMRRALPERVGIKAAGGIRSAAAAAAMLDAGASRLGTSSAVAIVDELTVDAVA